MENIITSQEYLKEKGITGQQAKTISTWMIEFTKLHVEKELKEASEKAELDLISNYKKCEISNTSILESYPLENIK